MSFVDIIDSSGSSRNTMNSIISLMTLFVITVLLSPSSQSVRGWENDTDENHAEEEEELENHAEEEEENHAEENRAEENHAEKNHAEENKAVEIHAEENHAVEIHSIEKVLEELERQRLSCACINVFAGLTGGTCLSAGNCYVTCNSTCRDKTAAKGRGRCVSCLACKSLKPPKGKN